MSNTSKSAQDALISLHDELGSWRNVEEQININRAYLSQIAHGRRKPSKNVLIALGIQPTKYAPHPVMRLSALRRLMQSPYNNS